MKHLFSLFFVNGKFVILRYEKLKQELGDVKEKVEAEKDVEEELEEKVVEKDIEDKDNSEDSSEEK